MPTTFFTRQCSCPCYETGPAGCSSTPTDCFHFCNVTSIPESPTGYPQSPAGVSVLCQLQNITWSFIIARSNAAFEKAFCRWESLHQVKKGTDLGFDKTRESQVVCGYGSNHGHLKLFQNIIHKIFFRHH